MTGPFPGTYGYPPIPTPGGVLYPGGSNPTVTGAPGGITQQNNVGGGGNPASSNPLTGLLGGLLGAQGSSALYDSILLGLLGSGVYGNLTSGAKYGSYEDLLQQLYQTYAGQYGTQLGLATNTSQAYNDAYQQGIQRLINENTLFNNYTALGQNPGLLSQQINATTQPLSKELQDYIGNIVQGQVQQKGLGQSGPVFEETLAQALAPYAIQEQQMGQSALFNALQLPLSVPNLQPYQPLNNPALPAGPSAPGVTDLSSLLQILGQRAGGLTGITQALAGNPALGGGGGGTNINVSPIITGGSNTAYGGQGGGGGQGGQGGTVLGGGGGGGLSLPGGSGPGTPSNTGKINFPGTGFPPINVPTGTGPMSGPGQSGSNVNYQWPYGTVGMPQSTQDLYNWLAQNGFDPTTGMFNGYTPPVAGGGIFGPGGYPFGTLTGFPGEPTWGGDLSGLGIPGGGGTNWGDIFWGGGGGWGGTDLGYPDFSELMYMF